MELAKMVRTRREELGMSQDDLARKMGYKHRTSINKIENGRPVSQKIIIRLAEALDVPVSYLMGWEEEQKEKPTAADDGLSSKQKEVMELLMRLSPSDLDRAVSYLQFLSKN